MFSLLLVCCAAYISGVIAAPLISFLYTVLFIFCIFIAIIVTKLVFRFRVSLILIAAIMFFAGAARYLSATENTLYDKFPEKYINIEGTVCSLPKISQAKHKYRYEVTLDNISYLGNVYKTDRKILLNTDAELEFGDTFSAWGFLTDFSDASNEFGFDYKRFCKSRGIFARLTALEIHKTGEINSFSPRFLAGKLNSRIYKNMRAVLSYDDFAVSCAVLFGDKSSFDKKYQALLVRTGFARVLYSSFTHIAIMLMLISLLTSKKKYRDLYFIIAISFYLLFANSSSIALKTCITAGLIICAKQLKGYSDKLSILAFTVFLMTVYNPLLCFDGGFMMSVISTALLYLSYKPLYKRFSRFRTLKRLKLAAPLSVLTVLVFGAMPFSAYYFNGISLYSVFLVPIFIVFVIAVIFTVPLLFIGTGFYAALSPIRVVFHLALTILRIAPYAVEKLPFYYIMLPTPSVLGIIFYCLLWWIVIRAAKSKFNTPLTKLIAAASIGFFVCMLPNLDMNSLGIYFVNVGQGDAAVLHSGLFETVLIDGGGASDDQAYNIGDSIFLPYLVSHGFTSIDVAIVSHYHKDHVEGIVSAAENLRINTLILPDCMPENKYRKKLEELAKEKNIKTEYFRIGDEIRFRSGLTLTVIAPNPSLVDRNNENDTSLVMKVCYGDFTALFMGDFEGEEDLSPPHDIDLLKVSHHGSESGNSTEFLESVNPRIAVISVGKGNRYGLPNKAVISELEDLGATILRTDKLGDIRCRIDKKGNIRYNSLSEGELYDKKRR